MTTSTKKKSFKKEMLEWGVFLAILLGIYFTGLHTQIQRLFLATGFFQAATEVPVEEQTMADYNLRLRSLQGEAVDFKELAGKTIFMNLWATWCPPCVAEMPNIQSLYDQVAAEDIVFVMLSLDQDPNKAISFIEKKGFDFPVYFLDSHLPSVYETNSIPSTFVISPEGKIVTRHLGMANYNTTDFKEFLLSLNQSK